MSAGSLTAIFLLKVDRVADGAANCSDGKRQCSGCGDQCVRRSNHSQSGSWDDHTSETKASDGSKGAIWVLSFVVPDLAMERLTSWLQHCLGSLKPERHQKLSVCLH